MAYEIEFYPPVQDEIRSWNLPSDVVRDFYLKLRDAVESDYFLEKVYEIDPAFYEHCVAVDESTDSEYVFVLRMRLSSQNFLRVEQCSAFNRQAGKIVWSST